jgi:hypothetical protein
MAGTPANVRVWETGDVYIFDPAVTFAAGTHVPADIDTALHAAWLPGGLMLGDPGVEMPRDIDKQDLDAWQIKRYRTRFRGGKVDANFTLLEDNEVTEDLIAPEDQPSQKPRYLAVVFVDSDTGFTERRFTKRKSDLWVTNDNHSETPEGNPVQASLYPDSSKKIWTIQKGIPA